MRLIRTWPWLVLCLLAVFLLMFLESAKHKTLATLMYGALCEYVRNHDGSFPADLTSLAAWTRDRVRDEQRDAWRFDKWPHFCYVAGITTNDPPGTPVVIALPRGPGWRRGAVLSYKRGPMWLSADDRSNLIHSPWLLVSTNFNSEQALEEFKQRVRVILPEGETGITSPDSRIDSSGEGR